MDWQFSIWNPTKTALKAVYTPASPGGLMEGFVWSMKPSGDCGELRFQARPDLVSVAAGDITQLRLNPGNGWVDAHYGVVIKNPPARRKRKSQYVVAGGRELLKRRRMDSRFYRGNVEPEVIAADACIRLRHPALGMLPFPATGKILSSFYAPGVKLLEALESLASSVPRLELGVNASGFVFFAVPSGAASIPYALAGLRDLDIESEELASEVSLIISNGEPSRMLGTAFYGVTPFGSSNETYSDRLSVPLSYSVASPEHANYEAEATYVIPPGLNPFSSELVAAGRQQSSNMVNAENAFDGSDLTHAHVGSFSSGAFIQEFRAGDVFAPRMGTRLVYDSRGAIQVWISREVLTGGEARRDFLTFDLPATEGITEVMIVAPPSRGIGSSITTDQVTVFGRFWVGMDSPPANPLRVYRLEPLTLNTALLTDVANSLMLLPAQETATLEPKVVTGGKQHGYYLAPQPDVILTAVPDEGDLTVPSAEWRYALTTNVGIQTIIDLGNRSGDERTKRLRIRSREDLARAVNSLRILL